MCWRKDMDSMPKRMVAAMDNKIPDICHDVTFVVGKNKVEISCHKIFLAIASPVFEAMFSHRHNNSQETPSTRGIVIPDLHPDGLKSIIKYAYTGILNVDVKDLIATMYACHKYDIPELYKHCSQVLHTKLSLDNAVTAYQAALVLMDESLEKNTWEFIEANAAALLNSDQFLEFSVENLRTFLSLDFMPGLRSEVDVFQALMRWGRFECDQREIDTTDENLRKVLEPYLSLIRFPTMKADEFIEEVQTCGLLSLKDCNQLYQYFIMSGEKRVSIGATLQYPCKSRVFRRFVFCCKSINEKFEILPKENNHTDHFRMTGKAGTTIKLKSVGIVLPSNATNRSVSVSLYDYSIGAWIQSATGTVSKSLEISYIEFDHPVSLQLNMEYYQLTVNGHYGHSLPIDKRVELVKYSKELMNQSKFTWSAPNKLKLKLEFIPRNFVIWALQFEN